MKNGDFFLIWTSDCIVLWAPSCGVRAPKLGTFIRFNARCVKIYLYLVNCLLDDLRLYYQLIQQMMTND